MLGIGPWLRQPAHTYRPLHIGMTALLFVVYPIAGAVTGAGAARLIADDLLRRAVVIVWLAVAYAANAMLRLWSPSELATPRQQRDRRRGRNDRGAPAGRPWPAVGAQFVGGDHVWGVTLLVLMRIQ